MRRSIHLFFFMLFVAGMSSACDMNDIRSKFAKAADDEAVASSLIEQLKACKEKSGLVTGYLAATEAFMGKHAFLPTTKYSWCKRSETDFENAVAQEPANLEIRYLRLAVETNLPSFLNMSKHIEVDKRSVIRLLPNSTDPSLNSKTAKLLLDQKTCTKEEAIILRRYVH